MEFLLLVLVSVSHVVVGAPSSDYEYENEIYNWKPLKVPDSRTSYEVVGFGDSSLPTKVDKFDEMKSQQRTPILNRRKRSLHHLQSGYGIFKGYQYQAQPQVYVQPVQVQQPYQIQYQPQPYAHYNSPVLGTDLTSTHTQAKAISAHFGGRDGGIGVAAASASAASSAGDTLHHQHHGYAIRR